MLLLAAGDMCSMDVLVAEAKVIKYPVDDVKGGSGSKMKMWQGMEESLAKFYVASIVLALEYLHDQNLVSISLFMRGGCNMLNKNMRPGWHHKQKQALVAPAQGFRCMARVDWHAQHPTRFEQSMLAKFTAACIAG